MAATAAAKNRKIRQEALREQLARQKHVEKVVDIAEKLQKQAGSLEPSEIQSLRAAADLRMKLVNKYLPDLKAIEIESTEGEDSPPVEVHFHVKAAKGDIKTVNAKS